GGASASEHQHEHARPREVRYGKLSTGQEPDSLRSRADRAIPQHRPGVQPGAPGGARLVMGSPSSHPVPALDGCAQSTGEQCLMNRLMITSVLSLALIGCASIGSLTRAAEGQGVSPPDQWMAWGGDGTRTHFSAAAQITPENVAQLKPVWIYDPGTTGRGWENTPLLIDHMLYISDADSGDIVA